MNPESPAQQTSDQIHDPTKGQSDFEKRGDRQPRKRSAHNCSSDQSQPEALHPIDSYRRSRHSAHSSGAHSGSHSRQTPAHAAQRKPRQHSSRLRHARGTLHTDRDDRSPPAIPRRESDSESSPQPVFESDVPLVFRLNPNRGPGGLHIQKLSESVAYYHHL